MKLSLLIVCREIDDNLIRAVTSVSILDPQIIIDVSISNRKPLGIRKNSLISLAAYEWVLVLDTDEVVSKELVREINEMIQNSPKDINGFEIKYQNYIFGKQVFYGGEKYSRVQLFRKQSGTFIPVSIHERPSVMGKISKFSGVIHHYSYRSLGQVIKKFTKYAWQMAGEMYARHERVTVKKLFLYGPHMVWARAVKDEGWRDGWRGIVIAFCFGYMETLMYWFLIWRNVIGR